MAMNPSPVPEYAISQTVDSTIVVAFATRAERDAWLAACPKRERRRWVTVAIARGAIRGAPLPPAGCSVEITHRVT